ncbi:AAA family ATPase [Spiroplasma endosymbiont of Aspidapion aeneum]|uniref:AAA family ATPase n=1 Tax=Spiroplasma endosymbiont of Aspidapion aeneum TaxID=3066276 RepID=UPI00313A7F41
MIFIKRIEATGFKSFGNHTVINFENPLIGIVGPNGAGKSNINDAIRWAFGEQSNKSLRSDNNADIVFAGSKDQPALNYAEVTLVFDNSKKIFSNLDYDEVSVKRTYRKDSNESAYYINNQRVRLKDILDIALETGITKSSLAMISQGSVSNFVESKSDERRTFFDEAAGVSIYKKRKNEAIRELTKAKDNYARLNDIINEKEKILPKLEAQAKRAILFKNNFEKLKSMEVSKAIQEIDYFNEQIIPINKELTFVLKENNKVKKDIIDKRQLIKKIELLIRENQRKQLDSSKKITSIVQKMSESKIKLTTLNFSNMEKNSNNNEEKIIENSLRDYRENKLLLDTSNSTIINEEKLLKEAQEKLTTLKNLREKVISQLRYKDNLISEKKLSIDYLLNQKMSGSHLFEGVKVVMENKNNLPGIVGIVSDVFKINDDHKLAIEQLLRNAYQNIIVETSSNAKSAIDFLVSNKAGHATFLPLNTLKSNYIADKDRFVIQSAKGFVGFANELITTDKKYKIVADNLLANGIVMKDFASADELSKIYNKFHIVTLTGEHILPYGAINGGSKKRRRFDNIIDHSNEIEKIKKEIEKTSNEITELEESNTKLLKGISKVESSMTSFNSTIAHWNANKSNYLKNMEAASSSFYAIKQIDIRDFISGKTSLDTPDEKNTLSITLANLEADKEALEQKYNIYSNLVKSNELEKISQEEELNMYYQNNSVLNEKTISLNEKMKSYKRAVENNSELLMRNYQMTIESAQEYISEIKGHIEYDEFFVSQMRSSIFKLGGIDYEAIELYEKEKKDYDFILKELNDVSDSIKKIEEAITSLDGEMTYQFEKTIKDINNVLPTVFSSFFGGGTASIVFTDENDIIGTGIDIIVKPPGKNIQNLNLLSGGEKSLVALATLFSILKVRPIPLVILDEVEAPLDILNVERFAKYIKTFNEYTQFIVVTHRQGTMENCDSLFGATMEVPGVTNIVKINLVEARKHSVKEEI